MNDTYCIDNDLLISLVQNKHALWDKTLEVYKDKTRNAWQEICKN